MHYGNENRQVFTQVLGILYLRPGYDFRHTSPRFCGGVIGGCTRLSRSTPTKPTTLFLRGNRRCTLSQPGEIRHYEPNEKSLGMLRIRLSAHSV